MRRDIIEGTVFVSLDDTKRQIYAREEAHGHCWWVSQSKRYNDSEELKKVILRCNRYHTYHATHLPYLDPADLQKGRTIKTNCGAHVNLNRLRGSSLWHVTLVNWSHNHDREIPEGGHAPKRPTMEQKKVVASYAKSSNFSRSHITSILDTQFPDRSLEPRQQQMVIVLWWQSPTQRELGQHFHDILINDNTYNHNMYSYPLNIGVVINNFGASRNSWYAFHRVEDTDTHAWVFQCHLESARKPPDIVVSDRSGAVIAVVARTMPLTRHLYCLHHLKGNMANKLRLVIGAEWNNFVRDFWAAYRAVSPEEHYLNDELHSCRQKWAWAWTSHTFTAGIRTNGRVEVENWTNKMLGGPKKPLLELFNNLNECTNGQSAQEMIRAREISRKRHENNIESLFPGPLKLLRAYVGPFALQTCFKEMEKSVFYDTHVVHYCAY
ncbi:hypothetical protein PAXINDRAFT_70136 [Paxillus involutus ATCC 200175]|nr:hypothetical protein PAXINDRAFT_70136 [Paxillus involutus ATCC 200175]